MMKRTVFAWCLAAVVGLTSLGQAELIMDVQLDINGIFVAQDTDFHDVYRVTITNGDLVNDVTSLTLAFGPFPMDNGVNQTFADNDSFPVFGFAADSFFVLPPGQGELAVDVIDNGSILAASYTLQGIAVLIPAGETATVAMLSVPFGSPDPVSAMGWVPGQEVGLAVLSDGSSAPAAPFEAPVVYLPEPASLALLGLGGLAMIRRR